MAVSRVYRVTGSHPKSWAKAADATSRQFYKELTAQHESVEFLELEVVSLRAKTEPNPGGIGEFIVTLDITAVH